jgi:hypothetical protein
MTKEGWFHTALGAVFVALVGCNKEPAPAAPAAPGTAQASAENEPAEPQVSPSNRFSETGFDLELSPKRSYQVGTPGEAEIVLVAKAPFHVNEKYPYKFKTKQTQGIKYPAPVLKEGVKLETQRAVLPVSFTAETAGKQRLEGQFSFSVCTEEKCLIEKRPLALEIDVK